MANKRPVALKSKKDPFDLFDGRIKVYRTTSQVWQMQMWISEEQKYVRIIKDDRQRSSNSESRRQIRPLSRENQKEREGLLCYRR
jgi:hypothetical protein